MAPPKPTTPDAGAKKKVTPAQVAFLVDRYLADNGFHAALAAFRSDAAHLFSPHRAKPPPKGLLPLADILHDYIALKEGRVAVDSAMHAMHSLVSTYYSPPMAMMMPPLPPAPANTNAQPSSPPLVPPLFVASSSPPQPQGYASPVVHHYAHASTALLVQNSSDVSSSQAQQPTKKRKHSKSAGKTTTASKKSCIASATTSDTKGKAVASQLSNDTLPAAHPTSAEHSAMPKLPVQNSSVAKSLFRPLQPQLHSSPCTPQETYAIQNQDQTAAYPTQMPLPMSASAHTQQDIASSQCSIVSSSKTLIVSPLKGGAYYAVERSYHVSSPLKATTHKSTKREHVKGKLNFDITESRPVTDEQQICDKASTSSDEDKQDDFDIDFTNLDIFDGEFSFSELLLDLDLDTEGVHCQNPSMSAEVQRQEPVARSGYVTEDPALPDSVKSMAADFTEDFNSQGATSVTSLRAITKRIKIVSPVKGRTAS